MTRRWSHCSNNGHNSRTCPNRGGVKLFGVRLTDGSIQKSASMGNLSLLAGSSGGVSPNDGAELGAGSGANGYASEDLGRVPSSSCGERKKGTPWTEEEHRMFLLGLKNLGKGDWRGISRKYVITRTPTQVASHAQKFFIRQTNMTRKRRSSLFDMAPDQPMEPQPFEPQSFTPGHQEPEAQSSSGHQEPEAQSSSPTLDEECEPMDSKQETFLQPSGNHKSSCYPLPLVLPAYFPAFMHFALPHWPGYRQEASENQVHEIVKPTAVHSKLMTNIDELVSMSKLSIGDRSGKTSTSSLSLDLIGRSNRQSAFHANPSTKAAQA